jgi:hypothetical protein
MNKVYNVSLSNFDTIHSKGKCPLTNQERRAKERFVYEKLCKFCDIFIQEYKQDNSLATIDINILLFNFVEYVYAFFVYKNIGKKMYILDIKYLLQSCLQKQNKVVKNKVIFNSEALLFHHEHTLKQYEKIIVKELTLRQSESDIKISKQIKSML